LDWRTSRIAAAALATFCWYTLSRANQEATEMWERAGEATTVESEVVKDTSLIQLAPLKRLF